MATKELFYDNAYLQSFDATVLTCTPAKNGWLLTLDQTAFFPEGGGQPGDRGCLQVANTPDVAVTDTTLDGETILHHCAAPLAPGTAVHGQLNWPFRFDLMQQHSGEHLFSGVVHGRFGYDNVGFHMGADVLTVDFNGELTWPQLLEVEQQANHLVWQNLKTDIFFPTASALEALDYRSKKELTGRVRIVRFPGADVCACCGTHVARTGEVGLVKVLSCIKFRSGVRIELVCGSRAVACLSRWMEQNRQVSQHLSAKVDQTAQAVARMQQELEQTKYRLVALQDRLARQTAQTVAGQSNVLLFEPDLTGDSLRRYCNTVSEVCNGRCAVFSGTEETGYQYVIFDADTDLRPLLQQMHAALNGRGGGKPNFVQGTVRAPRTAIEAFFAAM